jgi:hypothetical protein
MMKRDGVKTMPQSNTNPTWTVLGATPGLHGENPAIRRSQNSTKEQYNLRPKAEGSSYLRAGVTNFLKTSEDNTIQIKVRANTSTALLDLH